MKYIFKITCFSDVHGDINSLNILFEREKNSSLYICLGDVVGYGPYQNECLEMIYNKKNLIFIKGNHENMFIDGNFDEKCSNLAKEFFNKSYELFDKKWVNYLKTLNDNFTYNGIKFNHTIDDMYIYPNSDVNKINFSGVNIIGHSHRQFILNKNDDIIINPGSLGQNRNDKNIGQYLNIYFYDNFFNIKNIEFCEFFNDKKFFLEEMILKNYSQNLINYYL